MRASLRRRFLFSGACLLTCGAFGLLPSTVSASAAPPCRQGKASEALVGAPTAKVAWRAGLLGSTRLHRGIPGAGGRRLGAVGPRAAPWLLVLRATLDRRGRCWLKVRLPWRPNRAAGWINARLVALRPTAWRIVVARAKRTLTVYRDGKVARQVRVVVGAPSTLTPRGLFSIVGAWRGDPNEFLGAWILGLTAHSNVLRRFEGGNGEVGIHGRGGASLLDPLGSAASHGCIRLANRAIEWIARAIGARQLPGVPVEVR